MSGAEQGQAPESFLPTEAPKPMVDERWRGEVLLGDRSGPMQRWLCAITYSDAPAAWPVAWIWYVGFGWSMQTEDNGHERDRILVAWARQRQSEHEAAEERMADVAQEFDSIVSERDLHLARQREACGMVAALLASAVPHPVEHPTMHAAWVAARAFLDGLEEQPVGGWRGGWYSFTSKQRGRVASWLDSTVHDLQVDREGMVKDLGFDFVAAAEALVGWVTP